MLVACGGSSENPEQETSTEQDTSPAPFSFAAISAAELNTTVTSETVTITGINTATNVSIVGGSFAIDGGDFTNSASTISNQQTLQVQLVTAPTNNTETVATVTVGDVNVKFTVTTKEAPASAQPTIIPAPTGTRTVDINYNVRHSVGGIDSFDRQKFITIHSENTEHDWFDNDQFSRNAANEQDDLITHFLDGYDVYLGRSTGGITWHLNQILEDPARPGFVSESDATSRANGAKWSYNNLPERKQSAYNHEDRAVDMIVGAQQHPFWPEGTLTKGSGWALSQTNTTEEPLGTATGHYMAQYFSKFFDATPNDGIRNGQIKPKYVEVMNEPLYDLTTVRDGADRVEPADVFRFHNTVANEIRKNNDDVLIGGYTTAFPDFDKDDFQRWFDRDKQFIDIAGENMDFYSIHLYDFPTFKNSERYRRGSNVEATMDMLESYSLRAFGETRPLVISEYGAQVHDHIGQGWTPIRNTHSIRATNSMLMQFMERPDMILKTIPFIVVKAEWGRNNGVPYGPRLMIQKFERDGEGAGDEWVYSDLVLFYQLWSDVKGTRIDTKANDLDIQTDAYIDGNTAYIILNSLEFDETDVALNHLGLGNNTITSVTIDHLTTKQDGTSGSVIETTTYNELPSTVELDAEATMIIKVEFGDDLSIDQSLTESKYYSDAHIEDINKDEAITVNINNVSVPSQGEAVLRLAVGRTHSLSLTPYVEINGHAIAIPEDFRGYDQKQGRTKSGRDNFYGVIEVPVPLEHLSQSNEITITFDDDGGKLASAALQVFESSIVLNRFTTN